MPRLRLVALTTFAASLVYLLLVVTGNWDSLVHPAPPAPSAPDSTPVRERCLDCHAGMTGFSPAHQPAAIGCASCHAGDRTAPTADLAHRGLVRIPGNLTDAPRTCGAAGCHDTIVPRVERSLMTTLAGVIANDRAAFGENSSDAHAFPPHVRDLGHTPADTHLRQLCASCHLGAPKTDFGPATPDSRGGGCNACHLVYSPAASADLARYQASPPTARQLPTVHPQLSLAIDNAHCFGCHSRSSRISTNYEGWHELREPPAPTALTADAASPGPQFRPLDDGRVLQRATPDIHHERGLDCVDCHTAREVMGDGQLHSTKADAVSLRCEDCHAATLRTIPATALDAESALVATLRRQMPAPHQRVATTRTGDLLINVLVEPDGTAHLRRKRTGELLPLRPPATACTAAGHTRLACSACHTSWAPRCVTCHTSFDTSAEGYDLLRQTATRGAWLESSGPFTASPPTLGVRTAPDASGRPREFIDTVIPGMILDLDRNTDPARPADRVFHRTFASTAAHTTRREVRSCESCHNDPAALGLGAGTLTYTTARATGSWSFRPDLAPRAEDGLPADAWTALFRDANPAPALRPDLRPFNPAEQRRILLVGACLTCHAADSAVRRALPAEFPRLLAHRSPRCVLPAGWPATESSSPSP